MELGDVANDARFLTTPPDHKPGRCNRDRQAELGRYPTEEVVRRLDAARCRAGRSMIKKVVDDQQVQQRSSSGRCRMRCWAR